MLSFSAVSAESLATSTDAASRYVTEGERDISLELGSCLEWLLGGEFERDEKSRGLWCDGVILESVWRLSLSRLWFDGSAWCADHREQWEVPLRVEFTFTSQEPPTLDRIHFWLGDAQAGSLRVKRASRRIEAPDSWLMEFTVSRPPESPPPDPEAALSRILSWLAENAGRPLVGPEWEPLSPEEVRELVYERARSGLDVELEEHWLDDGMSLRVT